MPNTPIMLLVVGLAVVLALAVAGWTFHQKNQKQKSERLHRRFGPEYDHVIDRLGSKSQAEAELAAREKRVAQFHIVALTPEDAARLTQAWKDLQARFVDDPKGVVVEADTLVRELMQKRGFPMGDFERLAADISVDHPHVVENYRAAQLIADRNSRGEADTEQLRSAVVHYRALFDELLEVTDASPAPLPVAAE